MKIESLNIELDGRRIITDIDDCIIKTTESIQKSGLIKREFWFNSDVYNENKLNVFNNAVFTDWGKELLSIVENLKTLDVEFLTSAQDRIDIISNKMNVDPFLIKEGFSDEEKVKYLNEIKEPCIYVDDKLSVILNVNNDFIQCINYPKISARFINGRFRRF